MQVNSRLLSNQLMQTVGRFAPAADQLNRYTHKENL